MAELFLQKGANLNQQDEAGNTPLLLAVQEEHLALVQLFLEKGADLLIQNYQGKTVFSVANEKQHSRMLLIQEH